MFVSLLILVLASTEIFAETCSTERKDAETRLIKDLFGNKSIKLRSPINNFSQPVNITWTTAMDSFQVTFYQTYQVVLGFKYVMEWMSTCLSWETDKYEQFNSLGNVGNKIWKPTWTTTNSDSGDTAYTFHYDLYCRLSHDGFTTCSYQQGFVLMCHPINHRYWPYDKQRCDLNLTARKENKQKFNIQFREFWSENYKKFGIVSNGWDISAVMITNIEPSIVKKNDNGGIKIAVIMQRIPNLMTAYIAYPIIAAAILTICGLTLDTADVKKLIILFLSLGLHYQLLTIVNDEIPKPVVATPLLLLFVRDSLAMSAVALLTSLWTYCASARRHVTPPPRWTRAACALLERSRLDAVLLFYNYEPRKLDPQGNGPSTVSERENHEEWQRLANRINCLQIIIIGFSYFVYFCIFLQFFIDIGRQ